MMAPDACSVSTGPFMYPRSRARVGCVGISPPRSCRGPTPCRTGPSRTRRIAEEDALQTRDVTHRWRHHHSQALHT